ncbi:MAG: type II secretion system protein [Candidatus Muiribacteriota bacterium]
MFPLIKNKKAFTLVELIAVTAIISFLSYVSVPFGESVYENAREEQVQVSLERMRNALDNYYRDHGYYPQIPTFTPGEDGVTALQVLERELAGKEIDDYGPHTDPTYYEQVQKVYLSEIPPNPFTGKKEDWEIRDSYIPSWRSANQAMQPATGTAWGDDISAETGTFASGDIQATGTFHDETQFERTYDIYDIRFPGYLNRTTIKGGRERDLSEF